MSKLECYSLDGWTAKWVKNSLEDLAQRIIVNGSHST